MLLGAAAYMLLLQSFSQLKKKEEEYSAIVALLGHMRGKLASGGGRLCDILHGFASRALEDNGLLAVLKNDGIRNSPGGNVARNCFFRDSIGKIEFRIDKRDAEKLTAYFESYGKSYIEEEKRKLDEITDYFCGKEKSFSEKTEKDIKARQAVFAFAFVGLFIALL